MKRILLFLFLIAITGSAGSQVIKLKVDLGNSYGLCSYKQRLTDRYNYKGISQEEYTLKKNNVSFKDFLYSPEIGIKLEYVHKDRNHFSLGAFLNEGPCIGQTLIFNEGFYSVQNYMVVSPHFYNIVGEVYAKKFSLSYYREYRKNWFSISPMIGTSFVTLNTKRGVNRYDTITYDRYGAYPDRLFNDSGYMANVTVMVYNKSNFSLSAGCNFGFYTKKRELINLQLYYEQGLRILIYSRNEIYRNQKMFSSYIYSYGSAFHIKVSVPIKLLDVRNLSKRKYKQLTGRAAANQITIHPERPYGLTVNMGGDDVTLVSVVYRRGE